MSELKQAALQALEWFECLGDVEPYTLPDFVPVEDALRAALSQPEPEAVQVPQGWRMVPEEPTPEMVDSFENSMECATTYVRNFKAAYCAMLAAAPQPPAQAEPKPAAPGTYPPCAGMNCGCTDGFSHSLECQAEHAAAIAGGRFVKAQAEARGDEPVRFPLSADEQRTALKSAQKVDDWMAAGCAEADTPRTSIAVLRELARWVVHESAHPAPAAPQAGEAEPLFLLHTGQIDGGGEQDEWETEANSWTAVEEFCRQHPGKTIGLYPASQPMSREGVSDPETVSLIEECRDAFDEELSAWDLDPPLHHVQQGYEKCVAWLSAHGIGSGSGSGEGVA